MNEQDYKTFIQENILNQLIQNDPYILPECEQAAKQEMMAYLHRFDTILLFLNYNDYPHFKMLWIDITLYHLHARINPKNIPEIRIIRYNDAVNFLKQVNEGKIITDYPALPHPDTFFIKFGSTIKPTDFHF